jgi:hypothetical protein
LYATIDSADQEESFAICIAQEMFRNHRMPDAALSSFTGGAIIESIGSFIIVELVLSDVDDVVIVVRAVNLAISQTGQEAGGSACDCVLIRVRIVRRTIYRPRGDPWVFRRTLVCSIGPV